jgi:hypothetical protein
LREAASIEQAAVTEVLVAAVARRAATVIEIGATVIEVGTTLFEASVARAGTAVEASILRDGAAGGHAHCQCRCGNGHAL